MTHFDEVRQPDQQDAQYLEFDLDDATLAEVEALAKSQAVTIFEMCARLLRERVTGSFQGVNPSTLEAGSLPACE